jgi:hypothetical protein
MTVAATEQVLHIKNTSSSKNMVVTYLRHQVVGGDGTVPSVDGASHYFEVVVGSTRTGGTAVTPVNMYTNHGNTAEVEAYNDATVTGGSVVDKWFTKAFGDMNTFNKEGSLVIPPNQGMHIAYTHLNTTGKVYARVSFVMEEQ